MSDNNTEARNVARTGAPLIKTWRERIGAAADFPLYAPTDVERAMEAEIAALRANWCVSGPLNGIPATFRHDEGAIARCSYCGRYTLDRDALSSGRQPACQCGKQNGWSGGFAKPEPDSKWSGTAPAAAAKQSTAELPPVTTLTGEQLHKFYVEARGGVDEGLVAVANAAIAAHLAGKSQATTLTGEQLHKFYVEARGGVYEGLVAVANAAIAAHLAGKSQATRAVPEGFVLVPAAASADEIVSRLYRRFKDWSARGFGPNDVTWCEVKADVLAMIAETQSAPTEQEVTQHLPDAPACTCPSGDGSLHWPCPQHPPEATTASARGENAELIELLMASRLNYGAVGSRDVDVAVQRQRIDRAIELLSAGARAQKGGAS